MARSRDFVKTRSLRLLRGLIGDGLLLAEGDLWLRQRRLVQPAFHRQRVAAYGEVMADHATRRAAAWAPGAVVDVHEEMMTVTQGIVAKTLFDADVSDDSHTVGDAARDVTEFFATRVGSLLQLLPLWLPTPAHLRLNRAIRQLDAVVYPMIAARRRAAVDRGDLMSILLHAQDADDGSRMTDRHVRDEVMTLFLAGHETTAVALTWTWVLLAQHPEADARLAEELLAVLGGRPPAVSDLPALRYTDMVVTESMRLYPPAYALARQAARATEAGGHPLARRDVVITPTWMVHRDPRWFDEPDAFRPERWDGRPRPPAAAVRLLSLRRRPASVHRQRLRPDGGGPDPGRDRPALPPRAGARAAPAAAAVDHAAGRPRRSGCDWRRGDLPPYPGPVTGRTRPSPRGQRGSSPAPPRSAR